MLTYLNTTQLSKLEGVSADAIKRRIYKGKYRLVQREPEPGKGGHRRWLISIYDSAISQDVRDLYERQATKFFGLPAVEDIHRLTRLLEEEVTLLRENNLLLQWIAKRLK